MIDKLKEKLNCLLKDKETDKEKFQKILQKLEKKHKELLKEKDETKKLKAVEKLIRRTKEKINNI